MEKIHSICVQCGVNVGLRSPSRVERVDIGSLIGDCGRLWAIAGDCCHYLSLSFLFSTFSVCCRHGGRNKHFKSNRYARSRRQQINWVSRPSIWEKSEHDSMLTVLLWIHDSVVVSVFCSRWAIFWSWNIVLSSSIHSIRTKMNCWLVLIMVYDGMLAPVRIISPARWAEKTQVGLQSLAWQSIWHRINCLKQSIFGDSPGYTRDDLNFIFHFVWEQQIRNTNSVSTSNVIEADWHLRLTFRRRNSIELFVLFCFRVWAVFRGQKIRKFVSPFGKAFKWIQKDGNAGVRKISKANIVWLGTRNPCAREVNMVRAYCMRITHIFFHWESNARLFNY